jgi:hypothetical protein
MGEQYLVPTYGSHPSACGRQVGTRVPLDFSSVRMSRPDSKAPNHSSALSSPSLSPSSSRCAPPHQCLPSPSLSLLPHLAALLRISARFATCRFGVCPSDCLRLRRPNRRPLLACYRPDPHGPKALGLAWRR